MSIQGTTASGIRWIVDSTGAIVGYRNPVSDQDAAVAPDATNTAAQLASKASAGTLVPYTTYVARDVAPAQLQWARSATELQSFDSANHIGVANWADRPDAAGVAAGTILVAADLNNGRGAEWIADPANGVWRPRGGRQLVASGAYDVEYDYSALLNINSSAIVGSLTLPGGTVPFDGYVEIECEAAEVYAPSSSGNSIAFHCWLAWAGDTGKGVALGMVTPVSVGGGLISIYRGAKQMARAAWRLHARDAATALSAMAFMPGRGVSAQPDFISFEGDIDVRFQYQPLDAAGQNARGRFVSARIFVVG